MRKKRILLKLSGETLSGFKNNGIDFERVIEIAREVKECLDLGFSIGILATTMNALAFQDAFRQIDVPIRVETAIEMRKIAEFIYVKSMKNS